MVIQQYYSPAVSGDISGEALIFKRGVGHLFDEIRQSILQSKLYISPRRTKKKGKGATGSLGLAEGMNNSFATSLTSLGWKKRTAPGATEDRAEVDWYKAIPSSLSYGAKTIGVGLEIQFGNNFQFNEDVKRLSESILEGTIVAGVSIVPSDELAKYKADRGAFFSDAKSKLDRSLAILLGSGAAIIPGFVLIGIGADGFTDKDDGLFRLDAPVFDPTKPCSVGPISMKYLGTAPSKS